MVKGRLGLTLELFGALVAFFGGLGSALGLHLDPFWTTWDTFGGRGGVLGCNFGHFGIFDYMLLIL